MTKKMFYVLMVFCLVFTMIPATAFAAELGDNADAGIQSNRWRNEERYQGTTTEFYYNDDETRMVRATIKHYKLYQVSESGSGVEYFLYDLYRINLQRYDKTDNGGWMYVKEKDVVHRDVVNATDIYSFLLS